jgi:molybdopterin-containing oxidoreductase family iron-sulfur binding subunit
MTPHATQHAIDDDWNEFPPGALDAPTQMQRREFLRLMAASLALAEAGGCSRLPPEEIVPHTHNQQQTIPGVPAYYATSVLRNGYAMGVLVRSDDGRPTKIEGNPDHPASLGATDAIMQAELLTLYDPARSSVVRRRGTVADWSDFDGMLRERTRALVERGGEGLHIVLPPLTSPTTLAMIDRARSRLPRAEWYRHETLGSEVQAAGITLATGKDLEPIIDLRGARVVLALDADLFGATPHGVRLAHDVANARRESLDVGRVSSVLFVAEPAPTASGARADYRLAARRSDIPAIAGAIATGLGVRVDAPPPPESARRWIDRVTTALKNARGAGVVIAGPAQPPEVHALALAINAAIGSVGKTIRCIQPVERLRTACRPFGGCLDALEANVVDTLLLLGVNPAYDAVERERLARALPLARHSVHAGLYRDETALICEWHAPLSHELEQWGDARAFDGTAGIIQPLTEPIYGGRSLLRILAHLADVSPVVSDLELVQAHWQDQRAGAGWDSWWRSTLKSGIVPDSAAPHVDPGAIRSPASLPSRGEGAGIELAISPHPALLDGRHAGNAWLQELPDSITQLTWGNAALISPALAASLGVESGEVLALEAEGRRIEIPAMVVPGVAAETIGLALGYGRTAGGDVCVGRGVDVNQLRAIGSPWVIAGATAAGTGERRSFALGQVHSDMQGREIVRVLRPGEETLKPAKTVHLPLYNRTTPKSSQQWGMSIDLAACTGCGACVVACQAENNVPVVGPSEVGRGRRMHWLRVDRYFDGESDEAEIRFQPLACVQCEDAPCELVCPTGATQHSNDGLNEMNYARCIGTRYCSNNCPYKVRRFNFFRYADDAPEIQRMRNPRVTTRGRGVMEKCTYCVQRIRSAEFDARASNSRIPDGAAIPACQQACPTQAIVFGDVADTTTRVSRTKQSPRTYSPLGELNTKPRTTYLADVRPPRDEGGA